MALREFTDSDGTVWTAWDVPPPRVFEPPRAGGERRTTATAGYAPERRGSGDRRRRVANRHVQLGWLCFVSGTRKRRLCPPPPAWADATDQELVALCGRAEDSRPPPEAGRG